MGNILLNSFDVDALKSHLIVYVVVIEEIKLRTNEERTKVL